MMEPAIYARDELAGLMAQAHSPIYNYVLPGLTSYLIGDIAEDGIRTRMFVASRDQRIHVTPHNHKYDFTAKVVHGTVHNIAWNRVEGEDAYAVISLTGELGRYARTLEPNEVCGFAPHSSVYTAGASYSMLAPELHSVVFTKGSVIVIKEGPMVQPVTQILLPWVRGKVLDTMHVADWMFSK
jgi:hypothetical protein